MNKAKIDQMLVHARNLENARSANQRAADDLDYRTLRNIVETIAIALEEGDKPMTAMGQQAHLDAAMQYAGIEPKTVVNFGPGKDGQYTVRWEIDVKAASVRDAAQHARNIMKNPGSGNVLDVRPKGETGYYARIDLSNTGRMPDVPACVIVGDIATGFRAYGPYPNAGAAQDDADNCWEGQPCIVRNICDPSDSEWPVSEALPPVPFIVLAAPRGEELEAHGPWAIDNAQGFAQHMRSTLDYNTMLLPLEPCPVHEEHMFGID